MKHGCYFFYRGSQKLPLSEILEANYYFLMGKQFPKPISCLTLLARFLCLHPSNMELSNYNNNNNNNSNSNRSSNCRRPLMVSAATRATLSAVGQVWTGRCSGSWVLPVSISGRPAGLISSLESVREPVRRQANTLSLQRRGALLVPTHIRTRTHTHAHAHPLQRHTDAHAHVCTHTHVRTHARTHAHHTHAFT